jgi:diphthamide biosynthesis protein 7
VVPLPHAVFDLKFHPIRQHILGVAGSDGSISVYSVSKDDHNAGYPQIQHMWTTSVERPGVPALYFSWFPKDWFPLASIPYTDGFVVSFSNGQTRNCVLEPLSGKSYDIAKNKAGSWSFLTSEYLPERRKNIEPWFLALAKYENPRLPGGMESYMFTGDDMGTLWKQSYAFPDDGDHSYELAEMWPRCDYTNTDDEGRHHTAGGVTSILPLPIMHLVKNAPIILTGSYDENIRVYHATYKGSVLAEKRLDGGVWRLQIINVEDIKNRVAAFGNPVSEIRYLILASCMHAGTRILRVTWKRTHLSDNEIGDWDIEVLAQFTEHESMNYASGVWRGGNDATTGTELVCVSSSFYDKRLCLWKVQI